MNIKLKIRKQRKLKSFNPGDLVRLHKDEELVKELETFINKDILDRWKQSTGDIFRVQWGGKSVWTYVTDLNSNSSFNLPRKCLYKLVYYK